MTNIKIHPLPAQNLENEDSLDQEYSYAAELAWEYSNKVRSGEKPLKNNYYGRLPDKESREEFDFLISMNEFVGHFAEYQAVNSDAE